MFFNKILLLRKENVLKLIKNSKSMEELLKKRKKLLSLILGTRINSLTLYFVMFIFITFSSCEKEEIFYEEVAGVLSCKLQFEDNRVFECQVEQSNGIISNSVDSIFFDVNREYLKKMRLVFTKTRGAQLSIDGVALESGKTIVDLSSERQIVTSYNNVRKEYSISALVEKVDHSKTSGNRINADMTLTGLPVFNYYSATYFKEEYYVFGARFPQGKSAEGTAYYELYKSPDAGRWEKIETNIPVMGGFGANLIVANEQLFLVGGMRLWGTDVEGNKAPDLSSIQWRMYVTTDGTNWKDCTVGQKNNPSGRGFVQAIEYNGKIYLRKGKIFGYGMIMNSWDSYFYSTEDGTNWEKVQTSERGVSGLVDGAFFSFDNKLWLVGGYSSFLSKNRVSGDVWSSLDGGISWTKVASDIPRLQRVGMKAVVYGEKIYIVAGDAYNSEGTLVGVTDILASSDGVSWNSLEEKYKLPLSFKGRIIPSVFNTKENAFAIIGGYEQSKGYYMISGLDMLVRNDVWVKRINN